MSRSYKRLTFEEQVKYKMDYVKDLRSRKMLAEATEDANKQHYEVPAALYDHVMGPWKKYSCGLWPKGCRTLDESEDVALRTVCERAQITADAPLRILDMGCGWGSFTLYCATHFPNVSITSVSNSNSQREYINNQCKLRGLTNVNVITCDINVFDGAGREFDRVVSIEMMEHVKAYEMLLERVASWMRPGGKMFVHIFTHRTTPFHYTDGWMAEMFFTGGQMPSDDLLMHFQRDLSMRDHWILNGMEYERTCNEWLKRFDKERRDVLPILSATYGKGKEKEWLVNWRLFFIACAELFGYAKGEEWGVSHYLFEKPVRA
jgi:cyclopropane-fatty-acyl-phospholipid synthase